MNYVVARMLDQFQWRENWWGTKQAVHCRSIWRTTHDPSKNLILIYVHCRAIFFLSISQICICWAILNLVMCISLKQLWKKAINHDFFKFTKLKVTEQKHQINNWCNSALSLHVASPFKVFWSFIWSNVVIPFLYNKLCSVPWLAAEPFQSMSFVQCLLYRMRPVSMPSNRSGQVRLKEQFRK